MSDIAIRVENLGKQYRIGSKQARYKTLRDTLTGAFTTPFRRISSVARSGGQSSVVSDEIIWALKDVSFEVKRGEVVGVIGRNGAGKTTLLKILSRITEPTEGYAEIHGRVGSLLEVGTGFHPELTGRENIYLNGAILGMKRAEIGAKFDEIVDFSGVEKFIDTPVKHYSSGMHVRLAFAVAAHLEPEILLVDEVLAVGDAAFQRKCLGRMRDVAQVGRAVVLVSHDMAAIQSLCDRVLLLDNGSVSADGLAIPVIQQYCSQIEVGDGVFDFSERRQGTSEVVASIEGLRVVRSTMQPTSSVAMGETLGFELDYRSNVPLDQADFVIGVYNGYMHRVCQLSSARSGSFVDKRARQGTLRCLIPSPNLISGRYYLNLGIFAPNRKEAYCHIPQAAAFDVLDSDVFGTGKTPDPLGGPCFFLAEWDYERRNDT